jgi:hypothetical protein
MAKQAMKRAHANQASVPASTFKIVKDQWLAFLADFTRENRGAHARLEVIGEDIGDQVETENRPFDEVSIDVKDGEQVVWITFGTTPEDHLNHGVQNVVAIWVRLPSDQEGVALEIVAKDGTKTVLQLSRPEAYALPGAPRRTPTRPRRPRVTE